MMLAESVAERLRSPDFDRWMGAAASTGYCHNPVRLVGASTVVHGSSGEVISEYASSTEPDGVTFARCGNRRAKRCSSCSHEYKGDTWHMVMAGAAGGMKNVPDDVSTHPMVFLTLTAPSFGAVHTPAPGRRRGRCEHGEPRACSCSHDSDDAMLGDAVCSECYDYEGHVVWQFHAPELWRRFTIRVRRELARAMGMTHRRAAEAVRVEFAKVAEFQRRGVVHFHAIVRLDGVDATTPYAAPPVDATMSVLLRAVTAAVAGTRLRAPSLAEGGRTYSLAWGRQFDVRPIVRSEGPGGALSDRAVAAYIAKYATKATEELEPSGQSRMHIRRVASTVEHLARTVDPDGPYAQLARWERMLGFRGHFSTKSRAYSVTLGSLRGARRRWRLERLLKKQQGQAGPPSPDEVLVIGSWSFAGMGWSTDGDRALATTAAAAAREWRADRARSRFDTRSERKTA